MTLDATPENSPASQLDEQPRPWQIMTLLDIA
jgi:hypothetical protein